MDLLRLIGHRWLGQLVLLLAAVGAIVPLRAQTAPNLDLVEYFIDTDPGSGLGTAVALSATPGTTLSNLAFSVSLGALPAGFHTLGVRSRAGTSRWSQTYRQIFYKEPVTTVSTVPNIVGAEYFIDIDPGYGAGTAVSISGAGANAAGVAFTVGLGSVAPGFHSLSVRSKDALGSWSQTYRQIFYVEPVTTNAPPANLAAVEYFVDTDPGYGQGSSAAITGGGTNATGASFAVGLGTLSVGFHTLYYRVKDAAGKWSQTLGRLFYVDDPAVAAVPNLTKAEYYVDADPGYGLGTNVPIATPATNLPSLPLLADLSGLSDGAHRLFVRVRDANGRWSQVLSRLFTKSGCASSPNYASNLPAASYTGSGITATAVAQLFNGQAVTGGSSTLFNTYYVQADLGTAAQPVSEVQLSLQNVNGTAVNYTLQVETSSDLNTWSIVDTYAATLSANQTAPVPLVRTLATVQANVRGLRLRLLLPALAQGIRLTDAGVFYFNCVGPTITSFTPTSGPAGTLVTVTGANLGGATVVRFNGVAASAITNNTGTSLTVAAPVGGSNGQICVTTPSGTACSAASYTYPAAIATGPVSSTTFCAGATISVPFSTNAADFGVGNVFRFQLSDANGVFAATAPLLGTAGSLTANGGTVSGVIPLATPAGTGYRVRVVASNPAVTGADNSTNLTINTAPVSQAAGPATVANGAPIALVVSPTYPGATYVWTSSRAGYFSAQQNPTTSSTTPGVTRYTVTVTLGSCSYSSFVDVTVQPSIDPILTLNTFGGGLCLGAPRTIGFAVTGNPFPSGNILTAQLSDASGSFAAPMSLGSVSFSGLGNGSLTATVPATATVGGAYRIRLVGSNPSTIVSNDNGTNLTLNTPPVATASSNSPVPQGGTIELSGGAAAAGNTYRWTVQYTGGGSTIISNAQNLQLINATPNQSGTYTLTVTNAAGCTATASVPVVVTPAVPVTTLALGPLAGPLCAGTGYTLSYTAGGPSFGAGNVIAAQLSNASGSFAAAVSIGAVSTTAATAGTLPVIIPANTLAGTGYRIRLVSTSPALTSNDNGASLTITNLNTAAVGSNSPVVVGSPLSLTATGISGATYSWTGPNGYTATGPNQALGSATAANAGTYSVTISLNGCSTTVSTAVVVNPAPVGASIQTSSLASGYCAGSALSVSFTASGFTAGNVFTVQLSAAGGSFANPVSIGTLSGTSSGTIAAVLPAGTAPGAGYRIRVVGSQPATVGADNGTDLLIGAANAYTWLGAVSTSWSEPGNWSCGTVPTATSNVVIPAGRGTYPITSTGSTAHDLTIANGATLTLTGRFAFTGNLLNNGTLAAGTSTLVCSGTTSQTLGGSGALRLYDLELRNSAGTTLLSPLGVRHVLMLSAGNLASGGHLTLLSDATGTAMVVNPTGGGVVTGRATMERFITGVANTGYRHYSSPMQAGTATVQEFADDVPNFNLNPAYNIQGNSAWPFPTLFQYNEARLTAAAPAFEQGWMVPRATDDLTPGRGYSAQTAPSTVVDISGTLASADVTYPLSRGPLADAGWQLLGNPFPSPLDWDLVPTTEGIDRALYVYVPSGPYTGTYRSYVNGVGQNGGSKDLAAMQGFFIRATSATATLRLPAAARTQTYLSPVFGRTAAVAGATRPLIRLRLQSAAGLADEAVVYAEPAATPAFDKAHDAYKVQLNTNGVPSLWSMAGTESLAINALPSLAAGPSLPLGVRVSHSGAHTLQAAELLNLPAGTQVWLEDRELGTRQNLSLTPAYTFSMSDSYAGQRFYLWFETQGVLSLAPGALQAAAHLYPNPTSSSTTLEMSGLVGAGSVQLELLNTLGQVVLRRDLQPRAGLVREQLDLRSLASGVYSVRVFTPQGTVVKRLVRE